MRFKSVLSVLAFLTCGVLYSASEAAPPDKFRNEVRQPEKSEKPKTIVPRTVEEGLKHVGSIMLDEKKSLGLIVNDDGVPEFFIGDNVIENVDITYENDNVSIVGAFIDDDDELVAMQLDVSLTVTGNITIEVSDIDRSNPQRFNIRLTNQFTRIAAEVCNCYGGVNVPKRACLATECADPAECATGPQPSMAHCKYMEATVRYIQ